MVDKKKLWSTKVPSKSKNIIFQFINSINTLEVSFFLQIGHVFIIISALALRWGIHNKRITLEEIKDVSPQETVVIAKKIIENMPDEERKKLLKY